MNDNKHTTPSSQEGGRERVLGVFGSSAFLRFCINGCLAVGIQYAIYYLLLKVDVNVNMAFSVGYFVAFCCNFIITSYWTFKSRPSWKRLVGFSSSHIVNYFVQMGFLNLYLYLNIPESWAGIIAMGSAVPINFLLLRFVYKKKED